MVRQLLVRLLLMRQLLMRQLLMRLLVRLQLWVVVVGGRLGLWRCLRRLLRYMWLACTRQLRRPVAFRSTRRRKAHLGRHALLLLLVWGWRVTTWMLVHQILLGLWGGGLVDSTIDRGHLSVWNVGGANGGLREESLRVGLGVPRSRFQFRAFPIGIPALLAHVRWAQLVPAAQATLLWLPSMAILVTEARGIVAATVVRRGCLLLARRAIETPLRVPPLRVSPLRVVVGMRGKSPPGGLWQTVREWLVLRHWRWHPTGVSVHSRGAFLAQRV